MKFKPKGIIVPVATTFSDDNSKVDECRFRNLIEYILEGGAHGIFVAGTTGEFYALSNDEYKQVYEIAVDQVAGRVPVYGGAGAVTTDHMVKIVRYAQDAGVDAFTVLTPYFISLTQEEIYCHYRKIAENTDLPILMYDNKPKTGLTITPKTAVRLAGIDNIVGMKDSTGDLTNTFEIIRLTQGMDFTVLMGRDTLIYAALTYGAGGAVAGTANVAPRIAVDIYDRFVEGDLEGAKEAQFRLAPLRIAFTLGSFPTVIKEALNMINIDVGTCRMPTGRMTEIEQNQLWVILKGMELLK